MSATLIRFPVERIARHKVFAADACVVPLPKRKDDVTLLCEASFEAVRLSWQLLLDSVDGSWT
jgi:hypothetical protein